MQFANAQIKCRLYCLAFCRKNSILAPTATSESSPPATMTLYIFSYCKCRNIVQISKHLQWIFKYFRAI